MTKILFICHGNICRSPMAEFILKDMVRRAGLEERFMIASAGTSAEELGNPVDPRARRELARRGVRCENRSARRIARGDYAEYDLIVAMEQINVRNLLRMLGGDPENKNSPAALLCRQGRRHRRSVVQRPLFGRLRSDRNGLPGAVGGNSAGR